MLSSTLMPMPMRFRYFFSYKYRLMLEFSFQRYFRQFTTHHDCISQNKHFIGDLPSCLIIHNLPIKHYIHSTPLKWHCSTLATYGNLFFRVTHVDKTAVIIGHKICISYEFQRQIYFSITSHTLCIFLHIFHFHSSKPNHFAHLSLCVFTTLSIRDSN